MATKKKSNKELNEELENVTKTVEVLQNLVKELSLTIKENNDVHTAKIEELESKVKKCLKTMKTGKKEIQVPCFTQNRVN